MRIAVVGIGGVGGYYGGLLAKHYSGNKDVEVIFIARGKHLDQIRLKGLRLLSERGDFSIQPDMATDRPGNSGTFDLVLFCVKGYDLEDSAKLIAPHVNENSVVITLLNGVDNAARLERILWKGKVLNGCVYIAAFIVEPGIIRQAGGSCKLFFGSEANASFDGKSIEKILRAAEIDAEYRQDIESVVWEKYTFICPFAGATTFLDKTIRGVLDDPEGREILEGLLEEVVTIANARKVNLSENIREATIKKAFVFPHETKTSMQQDFEKGKSAELETFTGYILREGEKLGIDLPYHTKVYEALRERLPA